MAEQQAILSAPFPAPPPFYKHFTKQNTSHIQQLRKDANAKQEPTGDAETAPGLASLPSELRYLIPPLTPDKGRYRTFGVDVDLHAPDATLTAAGIEQLYPPLASLALSPQIHLLALTRSVLTTFLSLTGILAENPTEYYATRVEDLQTTMYNLHNLINQYRPHQAWESLLFTMEERMEKMRDETQRIHQAKFKVEDLLKELEDANNARCPRGGGASEPTGETARVNTTSQRASAGSDRQRRAWTAIHQESADPT